MYVPAKDAGTVTAFHTPVLIVRSIMRNSVCVVFSILVSLSAPALACSCGEMLTLEAWYQAHSIVAVVKVSEVRLDSRVSHFTVASTGERGQRTEYYTKGYAELVEVIKGTPKKKIKISGTTPDNGCYVPHVVGVEYEVFMSDPGKASFNFCSFPTEAALIPKDIFEQWRGNASSK